MIQEFDIANHSVGRVQVLFQWTVNFCTASPVQDSRLAADEGVECMQLKLKETKVWPYYRTVNFCSVSTAQDPGLALRKKAWSACSPSSREPRFEHAIGPSTSVEVVLR